jgi:HSP20 family protein
MSDAATKMSKTPGTAVEVKSPGERVRPLPALRGLAFDRLFDELLDDFEHGFRWPARLRRRLEPILAEAPRMAKVDVFENPDEVVVKAELPGITKDQIEVTATGDTVTIKAEKKREEEVKHEDYFRSERSFGSVARTVELPAEVKADKAVAKMGDGVLEVRIPKTDAAKASTVQVKVQ